MTKNNAEELIDQFGEIKLNGKYYDTSIHGWIKEVNSKTMTFRLSEGNIKMQIPLIQVKDFIPKELNKSLSVPKY